jgi:geranylgeranyl diphosphate synthase type I
MNETMPAALTEHRSEIDASLWDATRHRTSPLYRMMEYHLGFRNEQGEEFTITEAKRVRPALCLLSSEMLGGQLSDALPAATAIELLHNFSLIHDDIQDGSPYRHNRPTLWWQWGPSQAINAGDGMHAMAHEALTSLLANQRTDAFVAATQRLDQACLLICEGQHDDIDFQEKINLAPSDYMKMAQLKTGALMGCSMALGAICSTADSQTIETFHRSGEKLGVAFQIVDDLLDLWPHDEATSPPGDILSKKKTLPVIYAFSKADAKQKRRLGSIYLKRVLDVQDVKDILDIIESMGARDYSVEIAKSLCSSALEDMSSTLPSGVSLEPLREVADFFVDRTI